MKKRSILGLMASCALSLAMTASATDWTAGTGAWEDAANWSGGLPSSTVSAQVINGGTANSTGAVNAVSYFTVGSDSGSGTVNISTGKLTAAHSTYLGNKGAGMINVTGGAAFSGQWVGIGLNDGGSGHLSVAGSEDSKVDTYAGFSIGYSSSGSVAIDQGKVTANGGTDTYVGQAAGGIGTLSLTNGGRFYGGGMKVGDNASATGTINLDDGGYISVGYYIRVGVYGTGTVVQTGGILHCGASNAGLSLGGYDGSFGSYTISGGLLDVKTSSTDGSNGFRLGGWNDTYDAAGTFKIIGSAATITMENYNQSSSGTLVTEIGTNGISVIDVNGSDSNGVANLDGTFEVVDSGADYGTYTILVASNGVSGTFDTLVFPNSEWGVVYGSNAVTVIHRKTEIISLKPVAGDVVEMLFECPSLELAYPLVKTDLVLGGSWADVGHSIDGSEPFITTNLSYSTVVSGTTNKIYLKATTPSAFFGIGEQ